MGVTAPNIVNIWTFKCHLGTSLHKIGHLIDSKDIGIIGRGIDQPEDHHILKRSFDTTENTHEAAVGFFYCYLSSYLLFFIH